VSLFKELRRRNVIRVAAAYAVATWLLLQIVDVVVPLLTLPEWVGRFVLLLLAIGFPIALIFAWAFEMTPEGLKKESEVDRSQSIVDQTARKLNHAIIGILSVALIWFAWDKFSGSEYKSADVTAVSVADVPVMMEKSVAVLPFVAMSRGEDDEYFADGLTEEILNSLAQLPELLVTSRTSAFSFKGQDLPVQEIAATLGVKNIVEGSVRRAGERLRVTAQLIRAEDGFHLWSENYDSTSTDAIEVQENIAEKIAVAMDIVLDEEKREAMRAAGLRDVEAFTHYQKGLELYNLAHGEMNQIDGLRQANAYFEKIMERVPDFARIYVLHSDLFVHILTNDAVGRVMPNVSAEEITKAHSAAIADYEAAVRYSLTTEMKITTALNLAYISGNWRGLTGRLDQVFSTPSCLTGNWLPNIANAVGYSDQLYEHAMRVIACDPRRSLSWFDASRTALWKGDMEEAQRLAREGMEVAPGTWLNQWEITLLIAAGSFDEANLEIESRIQNVAATLYLRTMMAARQGDGDLARMLTERFDSEVGRRIWSIILRAWSGGRDGANRLAAEMDRHDSGLTTMVGTVFWCACGAPWDLEATPRFAAKLEEASLPWPPATPISFPLKDW